MERLLTNAKLHYPEAKEWMWNYCIYLGPFTSSKGNNYDLGVYLSENGFHSGAIVASNTPGDYYSPDLNSMENSNKDFYKETYRRAKELQLL